MIPSARTAEAILTNARTEEVSEAQGLLLGHPTFQKELMLHTTAVLHL